MTCSRKLYGPPFETKVHIHIDLYYNSRVHKRENNQPMLDTTQIVYTTIRPISAGILLLTY